MAVARDSVTGRLVQLVYVLCLICSALWYVIYGPLILMGLVVEGTDAFRSSDPIEIVLGVGFVLGGGLVIYGLGWAIRWVTTGNSASVFDRWRTS